MGMTVGIDYVQGVNLSSKSLLYNNLILLLMYRDTHQNFLQYSNIMFGWTKRHMAGIK